MDGDGDMIPARVDPEGPHDRATDADGHDVVVMLRCEWL